MHERRQGLDQWLQNTASKINARAYDFCSFGVRLKTVLHGPRIEQHAGCTHVKNLLVRLRDLNAAGAHNMQVACGICLVVIGDAAEPTAKEDLCRKSEVAEDRL